MRVLACVFLIATVSGCHAKGEARAVADAVDAFRAASNDAKPDKADALDKVACTDAYVCEVKLACTKSADATAKGLRLQKEVERFAHDSGPYPDDLAEKWKQANFSLSEGYGLLETCRLKTEQLRTEFGI